ncbi:hypothetical protein B7463_g8652, partial [Scytalidium lignicola]
MAIPISHILNSPRTPPLTAISIPSLPPTPSPVQPIPESLLIPGPSPPPLPPSSTASPAFSWDPTPLPLPIPAPQSPFWTTLIPLTPSPPTSLVVEMPFSQATTTTHNPTPQTPRWLSPEIPDSQESQESTNNTMNSFEKSISTCTTRDLRLQIKTALLFGHKYKEISKVLGVLYHQIYWASKHPVIPQHVKKARKPAIITPQ